MELLLVYIDVFEHLPCVSAAVWHCIVSMCSHRNEWTESLVGTELPRSVETPPRMSVELRCDQNNSDVT